MLSLQSSNWFKPALGSIGEKAKVLLKVAESNTLFKDVTMYFYSLGCCILVSCPNILS